MAAALVNIAPPDWMEMEVPEGLMWLDVASSIAKKRNVKRK